jgi:hypothetical protein
MSVSHELIVKLEKKLEGAVVTLENHAIKVNGKLIPLNQFGNEELENFHKLAEGLKNDILEKVHSEVLKILKLEEKPIKDINTLALEAEAKLRLSEADLVTKMAEEDEASKDPELDASFTTESTTITEAVEPVILSATSSETSPEPSPEVPLT